MVKVLRSIFGGPLERYAAGFAEELGRQGYSRNSAAQHVCFIAHLDRWMRAGGVEVEGLSGPVIERYLAQRRAAGYVERPAVTLAGVHGIPAPIPCLEPAPPHRSFGAVVRASLPSTARDHSETATCHHEERLGMVRHGKARSWLVRG